MASRSSIGVTGNALGRREPCAKCGNAVFLAERLNVGTKLYHRTCFRCARCNNQLSLANCYETETGQYCCETCPDEEETDNVEVKTESKENIAHSFLSKLSRLDQFRNRSLSDEEKQKGLRKFEDDEYSADFENRLEETFEKLYQEQEDNSLFSKARSQYLSEHLLNENQNDALVPEINLEEISVGDSPPPLPKTKPPDESTSLETSLSNIDPTTVPVKSATVTTDSAVNKLDLKDVSRNEIDTVNSTNKPIDRCNQQNPASDSMLEEITPLREKNITKDNNRSLVKSRMLLFEAKDKANSDTSSISIINDSKIEEIDFKTPRSIDKTRYVSVFSEDLDIYKNNETYKSIRSDISSDSIVIVSSVSDVNSPLDKNQEPIPGTTKNLDKEFLEISDNVFESSNEPDLRKSEDIIPNSIQSLLVEEPIRNFDEAILEISDDSSIFESSNHSDLHNSEDFIPNSIKNLVVEEPKQNIDEKVLQISDDSNVFASSNNSEPQLIEDSDICIVDESKENDSIPKESISEDVTDPVPIPAVDAIHDDSNNSVIVDESYATNLDPPTNENTKTLPIDKSEYKDSILKRVLSKSVLENLSNDLSPVLIDTSLLDSNSSASNSHEYPADLNPFDDENEEGIRGIKDTRQVIKPSREDLTIITPESEKRNSTNPFGSSDEENEENKVEMRSKPPRPPVLGPGKNDEKKVIKAPIVSLNPFWSDEEEQDGKNKPVPRPRTKNLSTPEPKPRKPLMSNSGDRYDSNSSLSSMSSSISHTPGRKKKPAPLPPQIGISPEESKQSTPCTSAQHSPKSTPRIRKTRKAPLPPTSTPLIHNVNLNFPNVGNYSPINESGDCKSVTDSSNHLNLDTNDIENEKTSKDEKNRNRQSQNISSPVLSDTDSLSLAQQSSTGDKSTHGKWKRKKGLAPARPVPQRRQIQPLPLMELKRELDIIEMQQQGLEKQGVKLEQLIREQCEAPGACDETILSPEVEELVIELFELVNEKNELFRRQTELMYLRRQQRLEEEYADLEYQIRCLMERPEINKTDSDKAREEELINRLVEVVERRNQIVECLEMDRVREAEEDHSINTTLTEISTRREEESQNKTESPVKLSKKEKKKMKKENKLKGKGKTSDADKDIDESETSSLPEERKKEKKKKIWFLHK